MCLLKIKYYKVPIDNVPFKEIPSLEEFDERYIYCRSFSLKPFMKIDLQMVTVYDMFGDKVEYQNKLKDINPLFGNVISDPFPTRGKMKCIKIGEEENIVKKESLPDLKYSSNKNYAEANWFYMKEGDYMILSGIKSDFEKVRHLEGISIYGDNILRLRIVIEFLKKNIKKGKISLSEEDFKCIAYKVLKSEPSLMKTEDSIIWDGVNNWVPSMLLIPLYEDINPQYRGRVKD